jgi:hypothetical protein
MISVCSPQQVQGASGQVEGCDPKEGVPYVRAAAKAKPDWGHTSSWIHFQPGQANDKSGRPGENWY